MKNRIIKSLVEQNNAIFRQTKDQTVAIENYLSKNFIVSNFEKKFSAHTILIGTLNVKEDLKENAPCIPRNNAAHNVNDFLTDQIDIVDQNTTTDDNNSILSNIPGSAPDNSR